MFLTSLPTLVYLNTMLNAAFITWCSSSTVYTSVHTIVLPFTTHLLSFDIISALYGNVSVSSRVTSPT